MKGLFRYFLIYLSTAAGILAIAFLTSCDRFSASQDLMEHPAAQAVAVITPEPSASPVPTPSPSSPPVSMIVYTPDESHPFPDTTEPLTLGNSFRLGGVVTSNYPLTSIQVMILCDYNEDPFYPYIQEVHFDPQWDIKTYSLSDATPDGESLDSLVRFSQLQTGYHTMYLLASNTQQSFPVTLASTRFLILGKKWKHFTKDDFSNGSYATALNFFSQSPQRFLYRYQHGWDRYTIADPQWEALYLTEIVMVGGDPWRIHKDALPYYQKARQYLYSSSVRVHGTNGDSGVLPLYQLIEGYYGSYLSRFTSSKKFISHHALGTATDLNADMEPNKNTKENISLINDEVRNALSYQGILIYNGVSYYDFLYSGSYENALCGIPQTVINYILYELVFYRAGFQWGHYYHSTSDAMHFTLTDRIPISHDDPEGLRKVFAYYD